MLSADGFDKCVIGVGSKAGVECLVYDWDKCVDLLVERDGMEYDEAVEFMDFNVTGAYVGEDTPIFVRVIEDMETIEEMYNVTPWYNNGEE